MNKKTIISLVLILALFLATILTAVFLKKTTEKKVKAGASGVTFSILPSSDTFSLNQTKTVTLMVSFTNGSAEEKLDYLKTEIIFPKEYFNLADYLDTSTSNLGKILRVDGPTVANQEGRIVIKLGAASPGSGPSTDKAITVAKIPFKAVKQTGESQTITIDKSKTQVVNNLSAEITINNPQSASYTVSEEGVSATPPALKGCYQLCNTQQDCQEGLVCGSGWCPPDQICIAVLQCYNPLCPYEETCLCDEANLIKVGSITFRAKAGASGNASIDFREDKQSMVVEKETALDILGQVTGIIIKILGGIPEETPIISFKVKFRSLTEDVGPINVILRVKGGGLFKEFQDIQLTHLENGVYTANDVPLLDVPAGDGYKIFIKGPKHLAKGFDGINLVSGSNSMFDLTGTELEPGDLPPQDGVINSQDISRVIELLEVAEPSEEELATADLNYDGVINGADVNELILTLSTKYDEDRY